jgi:hypothetical protein
LVFTAFAAVFWLKSAYVPIRNSLDYIVDDLWLAGNYNTIAATFACLAALCQIIGGLASPGRRRMARRESQIDFNPSSPV